MNLEEDNTLDKVGMILSGVCFVHCLALPFLTFTSPFMRDFLSNEVFHALMIFILFPLTLFTYIHGYKTHRQKRVLVIGLFGLALLTAGLLDHDHGHIDLHALIPTVLGGLALVAGHVLNIRQCRCHRHHH